MRREEGGGGSARASSVISESAQHQQVGGAAAATDRGRAHGQRAIMVVMALSSLRVWRRTEGVREGGSERGRGERK